VNLTIRYADSLDECALARLAALDSAAPLRLPALVADVEGDLHAAVSLADGAVTADPFRPTVELVELLQTRAAQLASSPRPSRRMRFAAVARLALRP
jgi:hypothetical protein